MSLHTPIRTHEPSGLVVLSNPAPQAPETSIHWVFPEFTCLCPVTGYPDFATVHCWWSPDRAILELKSVKLWLNSFRDQGHYHEAVSDHLLSTLWTVAEPLWAALYMDFSPRGNLYTGIWRYANPSGIPDIALRTMRPAGGAWRAGLAEG